MPPASTSTPSTCASRFGASRGTRRSLPRWRWWRPPVATDATRPTPAAKPPAWADAAGCAACRGAPDAAIVPFAWCDAQHTEACRTEGHASRHYVAVDGERYCAACLGAAWYRAHGWEPVAAGAGAAE